MLKACVHVRIEAGCVSIYIYISCHTITCSTIYIYINGCIPYIIPGKKYTNQTWEYFSCLIFVVNNRNFFIDSLRNSPTKTTSTLFKICHSFLRTKKSPDISSGHYDSWRIERHFGIFQGDSFQPAVKWSQIQGTWEMSFALPAREDWSRAPPGISGVGLKRFFPKHS